MPNYTRTLSFKHQLVIIRIGKEYSRHPTLIIIIIWFGKNININGNTKIAMPILHKKTGLYPAHY